MITLRRDQTCNALGCFTFLVSGGKKYIYPAGIEVPMDTDFKDVVVEEKAVPPRVEVLPDKEWTFIGSKGHEYTVARIDGLYACTCPASTFHQKKDCKHILQAKNES